MKKRSAIYLSMIVILLSGFTATADTKQVRDPMKYSEKQSKFYAEGDSNDPSGWEGCEYDDSEADAITRIQCTVTRDILVHGGHMVRTAFSCHFSFEPNINSGAYYVAYETCE
jgi:hypothetical protein